MFNNIGRKIQVIAKILIILGTIGSVFLGVLIGENTEYTIGLTLSIVGVVSSVLGSFFMYGFGMIVESESCITRLLAIDRMEKMCQEKEMSETTYKSRKREYLKDMELI